MAGFGQTGLLAANALRTFLAFIFKNALAAYNGKWGDCRFSIADCRLGGAFTRITRIYTNLGGEISHKERIVGSRRDPRAKARVGAVDEASTAARESVCAP